MIKTALQFDVAALSDTGRVRSMNQDAYGYSAEAQCYVVCDGMGGAAGGEIASQMAVESFLERLGLAGSMAGTGSPISKRIEQAVAAANRMIHTRAQRESALHGMGTTLVGLVLEESGSKAWIAHVGDSRCYLLRSDLLIRCTEDHSLVGEQMRLGQMTAEEAAVSPMRHVITRAVGVHRTLDVEVKEIAVHPGDLFLLCSDGLLRELAELRLAEMLRNAAPAAPLAPLCAALVEEALAAGGGDNITCLVVRAR